MKTIDLTERQYLPVHVRMIYSKFDGAQTIASTEGFLHFAEAFVFDKTLKRKIFKKWSELSSEQDVVWLRST
ncbi:hypothetical protein [Ohtaekwangia koreensis]|uniref:hypothetical protein n=1 Tax=Ohtaekwangia koreensis TaxID=688867 RepID=UPI0013562C1E|nr:hypothetical protein [Ohtaekwangia koreensis]